MKEIWKDIKEYEGLYQVSNLGKIKSLGRTIERIGVKGTKFYKNYPEKLLKQTKNKKGYLTVILSKNNKNKIIRVHRIVAQTFLDLKKNGKEVNHKDGNKENNCISNLEWITHQENIIHAYKNRLKKGSMLGKFGKEHNSSMQILQIDKNTNKIIRTFYGCNEAERETNINRTSINKCCNKKRKTAGGYIWKYKEV